MINKYFLIDDYSKTSYDKDKILIRYSLKGSSFYNKVVISETRALGFVGNVLVVSKTFTYQMVKVFFASLTFTKI